MADAEKPAMNEKLKEFLDSLRDDKDLAEKLRACSTVEEEYALASAKVSGFTLEEFKKMKEHMKEGPHGHGHGPGGPGGDGHRPPPPPDGREPPEKPDGETASTDTASAAEKTE